MSAPFLTILTPTYRRPRGLAACFESVWTQTAVARIQHVVMVDHVGRGIAEMFRRVRDYAPLVAGAYVLWLCDDDTLSTPSIVADLEAIVAAQGQPELVIADTVKGGARWPVDPAWPPRYAAIDLNCAVVRRDVWLAHVDAYGARYEGDYDHFSALAASGVRAVRWPVILTQGGVGRGVPEVAA